MLRLLLLLSNVAVSCANVDRQSCAINLDGSHTCLASHTHAAGGNEPRDYLRLWRTECDELLQDAEDDALEEAEPFTAQMPREDAEIEAAAGACVTEGGILILYRHSSTIR